MLGNPQLIRFRKRSNIAEDTGTIITNEPTGDPRTLFPLQAALGYDLAQSLFIGPNNLIVEGVTDYWILSSVSEYLIENKREGLRPDITITPAGGAQKVSYMVALLTSEQLNVLVLLDEEEKARTTKNDLVREKLIREKNILFVSEAFINTPPKEADTEDLIDADVYESLIRESYSNDLAGKTLTLNPKIPRIVKRIDVGLKNIGIELHKTRPARLLLNRMATDPASIMTEATINRFEKLFSVINKRYDQHIHRNEKSFN